jgi:hypothetical protein
MCYWSWVKLIETQIIIIININKVVKSSTIYVIDSFKFELTYLIKTKIFDY